MRIINTSCLHKFWEQYPETEESLKTWVCTASHQSWNDMADVIKTFPKAKTSAKSGVNFPILRGQFYLRADLHYQSKVLAIKTLGPLNENNSTIN